MRIIYLLLLLASMIGNVLAKDVPIVAKVDRVYDGDTFMITMSGLPENLSHISVRILGIDSPEIHGKCTDEKIWAVSAKEYLTNMLDGKYVTLTACTWDKYGSRIDCDVWQDGQSVSDQMIAKKMAVPYNGKRKVHSWCKI